MIKSYISPDDIATITCPKCLKSRNIPASQYRHKRHTLKVRCSCQYLFTILLDFRRHYRKETNLEGSYVMIPPAVGAGRLSILNISRSGVGFTVGLSISGSHSIIPGQKMKITFQLDNKKETVPEKDIIIRSVKDHYIGGDFYGASTSSDKELGFYLPP